MKFKNFEHIKPNLSKQEFENLSLELFNYQVRNNKIYAQFVEYLRINPDKVNRIEQIPFLPIELFKNHKVITEYHSLPDEKFTIFESSGTTGMQPSRHYIYDIKGYEKSFFTGFQMFYGNPQNYIILALLPSYLERSNSSLVFMVQKLIDATGHPDSGFYLYNYNDLYQKLLKLKQQNSRKVLLIGVSFALLDFTGKYQINFPKLIVMETGGMKGRRREMVREELHNILKQKFGVPQIHSEYGMTELLSQAYAPAGGRFKTPPWMKIIIRDMYDPLSIAEYGRTGGINVIDLANVYSCAFIQTKDLGKLHKDGTFEVLGRFDNSDLRGCNLMVA